MLTIEKPTAMDQMMPMAPSVITPAMLVKAANSWRDFYNPLRHLTLQRAEQMVDQGARGMFARLQWTYQKIEKRNPTHRACIARRLSAIGKMDWEIKQVDEDTTGFDQALADKQVEFLRSVYEGICNLREAIRHLAMAEFRGFSHLWKCDMDNDGFPDCLEILDQWTFVRRGRYGPWAFNPDSLDVAFESISGAEINRSDWIIREVQMPINEIGLFSFINKALSIKDWSAFVEIYGVPSWVITAPPDLPVDQVEAFRQAAEEIAKGGAGALPNGSTASSAASGQGMNPFESHLKYHDSELVLAATGGKLTMLTESGSGTLAGSAHQDAFDDIAEAEAAEISETFQRDLDMPLLMQAFPDAPMLAYFDICSPTDSEAVEAVDQIQKLSIAGFSVDPEDVKERTGFEVTPKLPVGQFPQLTQSGDMAMNRIGDANLGNGPVNTSGIYSATAGDLKPIIRRLKDIESMTDEDSQRKALQAMLAAYGDLAKEVLDNSDSAGEWEKLLGSSVVRGFTNPQQIPNRLKNYDDNQPRDSYGKWDSVGGTSIPGHVDPKAVYSPERLKQFASAHLEGKTEGAKWGHDISKFDNAVRHGDADYPDLGDVGMLHWTSGFKDLQSPQYVSAIRIGEVPKDGKSFNFRDQFFEPGVSVLSLEGQKRTDNQTFDKFNSGKKIRVHGYLHFKTGSDGEPIIVGAVKTQDQSNIK